MKTKRNFYQVLLLKFVLYVFMADFSTAQDLIRINQNIQVPMRDGIHLATDIYFPQKDGKVPIILFTILKILFHPCLA